MNNIGPEKRCACGKPLHYSDPKLQAMVTAMCRTLGENATVNSAQGSWLIPRHFIALHSWDPDDTPKLAARYGFRQVGPPPKLGEE